jgi:hypothetical protein
MRKNFPLKSDQWPNYRNKATPLIYDIAFNAFLVLNNWLKFLIHNLKQKRLGL